MVNVGNKKEDAQVRNELNAIKAQINATNNPAELSRLAGLTRNLLSSTNNPQLIEQIKSTQSAIYSKEESAEQNVSSKRISENIEARQRLNEQQHTLEDLEIIREREINEKHARLQENHPKIMQNSSELIKRKQQRNENLRNVSAKIKEGRDVSMEEMHSCIPTEEELKKEHEQEQVIKTHQKQLTEELKEAQEEKEIYEKQKVQLAEEAEKQHKINAKLPLHELEKGQQKLAGIEARQTITESRLQTLNAQIKYKIKAKKEIDKDIEKHEKEATKAREYQKEIKEAVDKQRKKNPKKYDAAFDDFSTLLLNANKAAETGEITDGELRNKFLGKENQPKNPEEILQVNSSIQAQSTQKNISEKTTDTTLKEQITDIKKDLKNVLENQRLMLSKNNQTEVDKQLNLTNQQTKKNKGRFRY